MKNEAKTKENNPERVGAKNSLAFWKGDWSLDIGLSRKYVLKNRDFKTGLPAFGKAGKVHNIDSGAVRQKMMLGDFRIKTVFHWKEKGRKRVVLIFLKSRR